MKIIFTFIIILSIIILWFTLDYSIGKRRKQLTTIPKIANNMSYSNIHLFTRGKDLFTDLFTEINNAEKHIHILFYIVKKDQISKEFLALLTKKAAAGIEVLLLLDWVGSMAVSRKLVKKFQQAGGKFSFCHVPHAPFFFYSLQVRNHRKITVIDGEIGYIGGYNIGKEYIDGDPPLSPWRDYHLKISGEGVRDLQKEFLIDWNRATGIYLLHDNRYFPNVKKGTCLHQLIPSQGVSLERTYSQLIQQAQYSIFIGSPYFIPNKQIVSDLIDSLHRGVDVTILVPFYSDHILVKEASLPYLRQLLQKGAKVYEYLNGFYHAKIILIDQSVCDIGTANFDRRSLFLNYELNCYIYEQTFIEEVSRVIEKDLADSKQLTLASLNNHNLFEKTKEVMAKAVAPFL